MIRLRLGLLIGLALLLYGTVMVFMAFDRQSHSASDTLRPFVITMAPGMDRRDRRGRGPAPIQGEVAGGPPVLDLAMVAIGLIAVGDYRAVWVKTEGDG